MLARRMMSPHLAISCEMKALNSAGESGIGSENSMAALDHYTQLKTVYVEMGEVATGYR